MTTRGSSHGQSRKSPLSRLPRLERLLLDTDVDVGIRPYLEAVGFRVQFALHVGVDVRSDTAILRWAREHGHILVCHDKHTDKTTRLELYPELYQHGGKIIRVSGNPSQSEITALGKILVHREKWSLWFADNDGEVIVTSQKIIYHDAHYLYTTHVQGALLTDPIETIRRRHPSRQRPREPRPNQPPGQSLLL